MNIRPRLRKHVHVYTPSSTTAERTRSKVTDEAEEKELGMPFANKRKVEKRAQGQTNNAYTSKARGPRKGMGNLKAIYT